MTTFNNDAAAHQSCGQDPLFPRDAVPEHQNIRSVTFCVRRADGIFVRLGNFEPDKVRCWDDVKQVLCAGLYRAVGLDEQHRPVAWYPHEDSRWVAILPGVEPCMVSDSAVVALEPPAAALPAVDPTGRAWTEADTERLRADTERLRADTERIRADTERLRAQTEHTQKQCAWLDTLNHAFLAMMQSPAATRPGGKPN